MEFPQSRRLVDVDGSTLGPSRQGRFLGRRECYECSAPSLSSDCHLEKDKTRSPRTSEVILPPESVPGDLVLEAHRPEHEPEKDQNTQISTPYHRREVIPDIGIPTTATRARQPNESNHRYLSHQLRVRFDNGTTEVVATTTTTPLPDATTTTTTQPAAPDATLSLPPPAGGGNVTETGQAPPTMTVTVITGPPPPSNAPSTVTDTNEHLSANLILVVTFCSVFGAVLLIGAGVFLCKRMRGRANRRAAQDSVYSKSSRSSHGFQRRSKGRQDGPVVGSLYGDDPYPNMAAEKGNEATAWDPKTAWDMSGLPHSPASIVLLPDPNRRLTLPGTMSRTHTRAGPQNGSPRSPRNYAPPGSSNHYGMPTSPNHYGLSTSPNRYDLAANTNYNGLSAMSASPNYYVPSRGRSLGHQDQWGSPRNYGPSRNTSNRGPSRNGSNYNHSRNGSNNNPSRNGSNRDPSRYGSVRAPSRSGSNYAPSRSPSSVYSPTMDQGARNVPYDPSNMI